MIYNNLGDMLIITPPMQSAKLEVRTRMKGIWKTFDNITSGQVLQSAISKLHSTCYVKKQNNKLYFSTQYFIWYILIFFIFILLSTINIVDWS